MGQLLSRIRGLYPDWRKSYWWLRTSYPVLGVVALVLVWHFGGVDAALFATPILAGIGLVIVIVGYTPWSRKPD